MDYRTDDGHRILLPEWRDSDIDGIDEAAWVAAIEAARRAQFAELAAL